MIKLVALLKRRPDLTLEEFRAYYEQRHAPLFKQSIPPEVADAIKHYVQNHALSLGSSSSDPPFWTPISANAIGRLRKRANATS